MACLAAPTAVFFLQPRCVFRSPACRPSLSAFYELPPSPYLSRHTPPPSSPPSEQSSSSLSPPSEPSSSSLSPPSQPSRSSLSPAAKPYERLVQWQRPSLGWVKLNFDASVYNDGSGRASIGGVIRDHDGRVLVAFAKTTAHASVGIVEARALIEGLRIAWDCKFLEGFQIVVEGDDRDLVRLLRREDTYTRIPKAMEDEIISRLGRFPGCDVQHIFREGNQVADALCHEAYQRPGEWRNGYVPPAVFDKVRDDIYGVKHKRAKVWDSSIRSLVS